jgi:hypothetical protein
MALKETIISIEKDKQNIKLTCSLVKMKLVYQVEDTRNDDLKNVYFINEVMAKHMYEDKMKELA